MSTCGLQSICGCSAAWADPFRTWLERKGEGEKKKLPQSGSIEAPCREHQQSLDFSLANHPFPPQQTR